MIVLADETVETVVKIASKMIKAEFSRNTLPLMKRMPCGYKTNLAILDPIDVEK